MICWLELLFLPVVLTAAGLKQKHSQINQPYDSIGFNTSHRKNYLTNIGSSIALPMAVVPVHAVESLYLALPAIQHRRELRWVESLTWTRSVL